MAPKDQHCAGQSCYHRNPIVFINSSSSHSPRLFLLFKSHSILISEEAARSGKTVGIPNAIEPTTSGLVSVMAVIPINFLLGVSLFYHFVCGVHLAIPSF
jgi:hypothetical protein